MAIRLKCVDQQIGKLLTKQQADTLQVDIERYARTNGVTLQQAAQQRITTLVQYEAARKRQAAFQAIRNQVIIDTATNPSVLKETAASKVWNKITFGKAKLFDEERAVLGLLRPDIAERITQNNVEKNADTILGEVNAIFAQEGVTQRQITTFLRNEKMAQDMYRELAIMSGHNIPSTGNAAAQKMAKAVHKVNEHLMLKYREAGGTFLELEEWVLSHSHDRAALIKAGKDEWVKFVSPLLNRKKIVDFDTKNSFDTAGLTATDAAKVDAKFKVFLDDVYDGIVYGRQTEAEAVKGKSKLANRLDKHRVLHFDPDQWLSYNERFGQSLMRTVSDNVDRLAGDIALMQMLGPNPDHGIEVMKNALRNALIAKKVSRQDQDKALKRIDDYYSEISGRAAVPENEGLATAMQDVRNVMTSAQLGSAMLLSLGDFGTVKMAAEWNGMSFARVMDSYQWLLRKGDNARMEAAKTGAIMDLLFGNQHALTRNVGHANDKDRLSATIADISMKASGLDQHTKALRMAFPTAMAMDASDMAKLPIAKMPKEWQRFSEVYGLDQAHWAAIDQAARISVNGYETLSRLEIDKVGDPKAREAAQRLFAGISHETDHAVLTTNASVEKMLRFGTRSGTVSGELVKSATMYKRFPMMFAMTNLARTLFNPRNTTQSTISRVASSVIYFTIAGAVGMNLRQIAAGKDPKDMTKPENWMEAFVVGGGGGPLFDLIFMAVDQEESKYREAAFLRYLGGPVTSLAAGQLMDAMQVVHDIADPNKDAGEVLRTYASKEFDQLRRNFVPGNSLWYLKLAYERAIVDHIQQVIDPEYAVRKARSVRRLLKEDEQEYFAPPMGGFERPPDIGALVGS